MGGVAEQGDPAAVKGRQRLGQLGHVVPEDVRRRDAREQCRDRLVPPAEQPDQFGQLVVGGPLAGRRGRGRVTVHPAVGQRHDAEDGAAPPALRHLNLAVHPGHPGLPGHRAGEQPPGGEPRVAQPRMAGEQGRAHRRADPVGGHHQVGRKLTGRGGDARCSRPAGLDRCHLGVQGQHPRRNTRRQRLDHGRPRQQDDRVPESVRNQLPGRAAHEPAAIGPLDAHLLRNRVLPQHVARAEHVQRPQPVRRQPECDPDRLKRRGAFTHSDIPAC